MGPAGGGVRSSMRPGENEEKPPRKPKAWIARQANMSTDAAIALRRFGSRDVGAARRVQGAGGTHELSAVSYSESVYSKLSATVTLSRCGSGAYVVL